MEPGELLEDSWFFGNLLDRKSRMSRSFSDPSTSSNFNAEEIISEKSYEETYVAIKKRDEATRPKLTRTQSSLVRQGQNVMTGKGSDSRRGQSSNRKSASASNALRRAPSLPTNLEKEEFQDEEIEFSMGELIRQASMNYSDRSLPPRQHAAKAITRSASISRQRLRRKPEVETIKIQGLDLEEPKPQRQLNHLKSQKTLTDLESEELQGFKDLGFDFGERDLSPTIAKIIPGLQEKKRSDEDGDKATRRPYLSEKWAAQSHAPPVPRWGRGGGGRPTEDMKAQIKFWARAVASNVRQEC